MSTVVVILESVALGCGLAFGVWARRSRNAAARRLAALEAQLDEQRSTAERREGVLRTVVETTPVAMVLFGDAGEITFTNRSARDLFFEGLPVEGQNFLSMIERAPESLRRAGPLGRRRAQVGADNLKAAGGLGLRLNMGRRSPSTSASTARWPPARPASTW
jgi:PAS domain-containing protein